MPQPVAQVPPFAMPPEFRTTKMASRRATKDLDLLGRGDPGVDWFDLLRTTAGVAERNCDVQERPRVVEGISRRHG